MVVFILSEEKFYLLCMTTYFSKMFSFNLEVIAQKNGKYYG